MDPYDFTQIEAKWRDVWETTEEHLTQNNNTKPNYYCLDMFPYPSGSGLHVGHWRGYVLSDVWARYKKLQGYHVLHPMGWDSFGLPAENDAIKKGIHPAINVRRNIDNIRRQLKEIGAMYDWSREINTSDPEYYRWTQWIFVQMYKKGLAYRKKMPINWCPHCKTGLANEEVINGKCERCASDVKKRELMQWMLKITAYADRLLDDLEKLDWPEKVKLMQRNWIGRSEGASITFSTEIAPLKVFTTRPDTLFGATYVVLAPEHELIHSLTTKEQKKEVERYIETSSRKSEIERTFVSKSKTGVFTGSYARNPVNNKKIPIWIADYVLAHYGSGAIMSVPAHDQRDFDFATAHNLPIIEVISHSDSLKNKTEPLPQSYEGEGVLINSGPFNGMSSSEAKPEIIKWLAAREKGEAVRTYKLRDWIFSRQRYWGEPIPVIYCDRCGEVILEEEDLPVLLPEVEQYQPSGTGASPLAAIPEFVHTTCPKCNAPATRETDTMPQWAGSSWYFLRYPNPSLSTAPFEKDHLEKWLPVACYVGGIEHAILHLLYARFFTKVLFDLGYIGFDEPFSKLFNQGMVCKYSEKTEKLEKMSKSKGNVVNPDSLVKRYGTDTVRLYELFIGPPEVDAEWNDNGIEGCYRFLKKFWELILRSATVSSSSPAVQQQIHLLIAKVTDRLASFKFNTAISAFMECVNICQSPGETLCAKDAETLIILLSPFAPHISEELWHRLGKRTSVFHSSWPLFDPKIIATEKIEIPIQINGKIRTVLKVEKNLSEEAIEKKVFENESVRTAIQGKSIIKKIYVPEKIFTIVIK
ncbi:MAG: leucine--tRNA ligase [Candidatus Ratteibacteria bacterium]|jgi:leucyl-tRNA synthetase